jgi:hypothetical protein
MNKLKDFGYSKTNYHSFKSTIDKEESELREIVCEKKGIEDSDYYLCTL